MTPASAGGCEPQAVGQLPWPEHLQLARCHVQQMPVARHNRIDPVRLRDQSSSVSAVLAGPGAVVDHRRSIAEGRVGQADRPPRAGTVQ
jgi:hypothetical protein